MALAPSTRARGANVQVKSAFEDVYGTPPDSGTWFVMPIVSHGLGAEQALIDNDLLGLGREPQDPTLDVVVNDGDVVVPVDIRNFGRILRLAFGAATVTGSAAKASGSYAFASQPAAGSTITVNGVVFTFVSATPTGNQILIGVNLAATLANAVTALNASSIAAVDIATYSTTTGALNIVADDGGAGGNAFTITASSSPASNATPSAATLTGGTLATHTFGSGASALPAMSIEVGHPEVPAFTRNYGARLNQLKIAMARSGLLNATCSLVCKGETAPVGSTIDSSPSSMVPKRFAQAAGAITKDGAALGSVVSAEFTYSNNLDKVDTITADGEIEDVDPAMAMASGNIKVRFANTTLLSAATNNTPVSLTFGWTFGAFSLLFTVQRVFLPRVKRPVDGPNGVLATFNWQASGALGTMMTAVLVTDVSAF